VSLRLAKYGAHLILLARNSVDLEALDDELHRQGCASTTLVPHDLRNVAELDSVTTALFERFGALDALVGNAAILGTLGPVLHTSPALFEEVMQVNFHANWRLLRACEPLLRRSQRGGHAVFITSSVVSQCPAYWGPYTASKAALEAMLRTYAKETQESPIHAYLIDPGALRTDMRATAFPGENPQTVPAPDFAATRIVDYFVGRSPVPSTAIVRF